MFVWLVACGGSSPQATSSSSPSTVPTTDSSPSTDSATGDTASGVGTGDTASSTYTGPLSGLAWELHPEVGSLVTVSWSQATASEVHVAYAFDDGTWMASPTFEAVAGLNERLLVGIPFDTVAEWKVVTPEGEREGPAIATAPLPVDLPVPVVSVNSPDGWYADGRYLLTSVNQEAGGWGRGTYWTVLLDREGRYVWAKPAPMQRWTLYPSVAQSGDHLLIDEATAWSDFDQGAGSTVVRTYLEAPIETVPTPGLHHAFWEHTDGTLAWGSLFHSEGEALVEQEAGATEQTVIWDCFADFPGVADNPTPRCESNSLWYDAGRDTYLYSFYTNSSVVELSRATGESLWWAGAQPGGFAFDPVESTFDWQHGIGWTEQGTLLLSSRAREPDLTTKLFEYEVDEVTGVLTEVWSYDAGVHASTNGDARRLPGGNTLHAVGSAGQIHEVDPSGNAVWVLDYQDTRLVGRAEWVSDLYALVAPRP